LRSNIHLLNIHLLLATNEVERQSSFSWKGGAT
jgi:hypothetical protein